MRDEMQRTVRMWSLDGTLWMEPEYWRRLKEGTKKRREAKYCAAEGPTAHLIAFLPRRTSAEFSWYFWYVDNANLDFPHSYIYLIVLMGTWETGKPTVMSCWEGKHPLQKTDLLFPLPQSPIILACAITFVWLYSSPELFQIPCHIWHTDHLFFIYLLIYLANVYSVLWDMFLRKNIHIPCQKKRDDDWEFLVWRAKGTINLRDCETHVSNEMSRNWDTLDN